MYYSSKSNFKITLLQVIMFFHCISIAQGSIFKKNALTDSSSVIASIDFPLLPKRPSFKDLYHSLNIPSIEQQPIVRPLEVKPQPAATPKIKSSDVNLDRDLSNIFNKTFDVPSDVLFSESLNALRLLNLPLKYLDMAEKKIITIDRDRNTILITVLPKDKLSSNIKIAGYSTVSGKDTLSRLSKQLILLISDKTKH